MAMFAGGLAAGALTPLLGMIPQAPGGPPNPFAPSSNGGSSTSASNPLTGIFNDIGGVFSNMKSKLPNMNLVLLVGGGIVLLILIK